MIAVIDIGNSRIHGGFFRGSRCVKRFDQPVSRPFRWKKSSAETTIIASVNPRITRNVVAELRRTTARRPVVLGRDLAVPIRTRYRTPSTVGVDRLANALAAYERVRGACMVVDVGTAVTFDVVSARGEFLGGAIAPGPAMAAQAMHRYGALLPLVTPVSMRRALARDTAGNLQSGIFWGLVGLIHQMARHVHRELGTKPAVIGTGGGIGLLRGRKIFDAVVPHLTLEGIALSYVHSLRAPCPFCRRIPSRR